MERGAETGWAWHRARAEGCAASRPPPVPPMPAPRSAGAKDAVPPVCPARGSAGLDRPRSPSAAPGAAAALGQRWRSARPGRCRLRRAPCQEAETPLTPPGPGPSEALALPAPGPGLGPPAPIGTARPGGSGAAPSLSPQRIRRGGPSPVTSAPPKKAPRQAGRAAGWAAATATAATAAARPAADMVSPVTVVSAGRGRAGRRGPRPLPRAPGRCPRSPSAVPAPGR